MAANGNLKISDFGLCAVYKHKGKQRLLSGRCGSLPYVAPEVRLYARGACAEKQLAVPTGYAAEPVDIWGMGVVLYTLLVGSMLPIPRRMLELNSRYTMGRAIGKQSRILGIPDWGDFQV